MSSDSTQLPSEGVQSDKLDLQPKTKMDVLLYHLERNAYEVSKHFYVRSKDKKNRYDLMRDPYRFISQSRRVDPETRIKMLENNDKFKLNPGHSLDTQTKWDFMDSGLQSIPVSGSSRGVPNELIYKQLQKKFNVPRPAPPSSVGTTEESNTEATNQIPAGQTSADHSSVTAFDFSDLEPCKGSPVVNFKLRVRGDRTMDFMCPFMNDIFYSDKNLTLRKSQDMAAKVEAFIQPGAYEERAAATARMAAEKAASKKAAEEAAAKEAAAKEKAVEEAAAKKAAEEAAAAQKAFCLEERAEAFRQNRERWISKEVYKNDVVLKPGTIPISLAEEEDPPNAIQYWQEVIEMTPKKNVMDLQKKGVHSFIPCELYPTMMGEVQIISVLKQILNVLFPQRAHVFRNDQKITLKFDNYHSDVLKLFEEYFDFQGCTTTRETNKRQRKFQHAVAYGVLATVSYAIDAGGVFPDVLRHFMDAAIENGLRHKILYMDDNSSSTSREPVYKLNFLAFADSCRSDFNRENSPKMVENFKALRLLVIGAILCNACRQVQGTPVILDPFLFTPMINSYPDCTQVRKVLLPCFYGYSYEPEAITDLATKMMNEGGGCFKSSDLSFENPLTPDFVFENGQINERVSIAPSFLVSSECVLNPLYLRYYLMTLGFSLTTIFTRVMDEIGAFFEVCGLDHQKIHDKLHSYKIDPENVRLVNKSHSNSSLPDCVNLYGFNELTAEFVGLLGNTRLRRAHLTFRKEGTLLYATGSDDESIFDETFEAFRCIAYALPNVKDAEGDPSTCNEEHQRMFFTHRRFSFEKEDVESSAIFDQRVKLMIPALIFQYQHDAGHGDKHVFKNKMLRRLAELNTLIRISKKFSLEGHEIFDELDLGRIADIDVRELTPSFMTSIKELVDQRERIAITAHKYLLTKYSQDAKRYSEMSNADLIHAMKARQNSAANGLCTVDTSPVLNEAEFDCPFAGEGVLCPICSIGWCRACLHNTEPCLLCKGKKECYTAHELINFMTGSRPCNQGMPLKVGIAYSTAVNTLHDFTWGTCSPSVSIHADEYLKVVYMLAREKGNGANGLVFKTLRHKLLNVLGKKVSDFTTI